MLCLPWIGPIWNKFVITWVMTTKNASLFVQSADLWEAILKSPYHFRQSSATNNTLNTYLRSSESFVPKSVLYQWKILDSITYGKQNAVNFLEFRKLQLNNLISNAKFVNFHLSAKCHIILCPSLICVLYKPTPNQHKLASRISLQTNSNYPPYICQSCTPHHLVMIYLICTNVHFLCTKTLGCCLKSSFQISWRVHTYSRTGLNGKAERRSIQLRSCMYYQ